MLIPTPKPPVIVCFVGARFALPDAMHMNTNKAEPITSVMKAPKVVTSGLGARTISISFGYEVGIPCVYSMLNTEE